MEWKDKKPKKNPETKRNEMKLGRYIDFDVLSLLMSFIV